MLDFNWRGVGEIYWKQKSQLGSSFLWLTGQKVGTMGWEVGAGEEWKWKY